MSENRIQSYTTAQTGERQTPKTSFGDVAKEGLKMVGAAASLVATATGSPIASAAVTGVSTVLSLGATANAAPTAAGVGRASPSAAPLAGGPVGGGAVGGGQGSDAMELMQMQQAMQAEGFKLNTVYLGMQREMQRESREFSAVSNIMKVRHDTAKSAINNVR